MIDLSKLTSLEGLITEDVGKVLYLYATGVVPEQAIVELGSYHGKSTAYLAAGARDGFRAPVLAVDAWNAKVNGWSKYHEPPQVIKFYEALKSVGLHEYVIACRGLTVPTAARYKNKPIGLLYVDADHSEEAVMADVKAWYPHLAPGALVIFDDFATTHNPGVGTAVVKLTTGPGALLVFEVLEADRLAVCRKQ